MGLALGIILFYFKMFIYLAASGLSEWGLLFIVVCSLLIVWHLLCGAWALGAGVLVAVCSSLVVVVHGLSCSEACGIFPDQGSNLCPMD